MGFQSRKARFKRFKSGPSLGNLDLLKKRKILQIDEKIPLKSIFFCIDKIYPSRFPFSFNFRLNFKSHHKGLLQAMFCFLRLLQFVHILVSDHESQAEKQERNH